MSYVRDGSTLHFDTLATPVPCMLYPNSVRSWAPQRNDAMCHNRTHAPQQKSRLLDYFVGAGEQRVRQREAKRSRSYQVHNEIEFRRLLNRDVGRLRPAQNLIDIVAHAPE